MGCPETTADYDMPYRNIFMILFLSLSLCKLAFKNLYYRRLRICRKRVHATSTEYRVLIWRRCLSCIMMHLWEFAETPEVKERTHNTKKSLPSEKTIDCIHCPWQFVRLDSYKRQRLNIHRPSGIDFGVQVCCLVAWRTVHTTCSPQVLIIHNPGKQYQERCR